MEKYITLPYLKTILGFVITITLISNIPNIIEGYTKYQQDKPAPVQKIACSHIIAGERPFLFSGKIVNIEEAAIQDWESRTDLPCLNFTAIFLKSDAGQYLLMYTQKVSESELKEGDKMLGWFINLKDQTFNGFNQQKVPNQAYPLSYPIMVKTIKD